MNDFNLERFLKAQDQNVSNYETALEEIKSGGKRTHWIWYIFPQIKGLGYSPASVFYAVSCIKEAVAYLAHPVLGKRLVEISSALLDSPVTNPVEIMGSSIDAQKLKSSMTLFATVSILEPVFEKVLDKFFDGEKDLNTLRILRQDLTADS